MECHQNSRALGLGQGNLTRTTQGWTFTPALSARPDLLGIDHPLDAFVDITGRALVYTSRAHLRPFNGEEIKRVLDVGICLACHRDFKDPVMAQWKPGRPPTPCANAP